jgi:hypothetical protein
MTTLTCSMCGKRIEGLLTYENHMRITHAKPRGGMRAGTLVRAVIALNVAREITREK